VWPIYFVLQLGHTTGGTSLYGVVLVVCLCVVTCFSSLQLGNTIARDIVVWCCSCLLSFVCVCDLFLFFTAWEHYSEGHRCMVLFSSSVCVRPVSLLYSLGTPQETGGTWWGLSRGTGYV